ncbi:MAG: rhodanese-like domain-containing protein [Azoarcus sp.]|nr:rhodanese-like domain-containing protein [Azoarcus sp.]
MEFLQQNLFWAALAVCSGTWLLVETIRQARDKSMATPLEAILLINREDATIVDVRATGDFEKGHMPNARNLPLVDLERRRAELDKFRTKPLLICCSDGVQTGKAIAALKKAGFEKLYGLRGGLYEWGKAGQPITRKKK